MKIFVVLLLSVLAVSLTDREILQQVLNGAFEQNKLQKPTTIIDCIDDKSAHQMVVFIGKLLDKASKGSISDLLSLHKLINNFEKQLDPAVGKCLDGNKQLQSLGPKYNPKNQSSDEIKKKVINYVTLHYLTVHKWLNNLDCIWGCKTYYDVGFRGSEYAHAILGISEQIEHNHPIHVKSKHSHIMKILKELRHLQQSLKL